MKSDQTIIRKNPMEQLNFIINLLGIKDKNIIILDYLDSKCPHCLGQMAKYDFQKEFKFPI